MSQIIYHKIPKVRRRDVFEVFIQYLLNNGWRAVNADTTHNYVLFSDGITGTRTIYLNIRRYEHSTQTSTSYNMSNPTGTVASNATYRWASAYNPSNNSFTYESSWMHLPFRGGKSYAADPDRGSVSSEGDAELDLYIYADKDRFAFFTKSPEYTGYDEAYNFVGIPLERFFEENEDGFPSSFVYASSAGIPSAPNSNNGYATVAGRPRAINDNKKNYSLKAESTWFQAATNADGRTNAADILLSNEQEGIRFRLGMGYQLDGVSGTFLNINNRNILKQEVNGQEEHYLYIYVPNLTGIYALHLRMLFRIK